MINNSANQLPYLKSMIICLGKVVKDGYVNDFEVADQGIWSARTKRMYSPGDIKVVNVMRFEGLSAPGELATIYIIETSDGIKGTLVDASEGFDDQKIDVFMREVYDLKKKITH